MGDQDRVCWCGEVGCAGWELGDVCRCGDCAGWELGDVCQSREVTPICGHCQMY